MRKRWYILAAIFGLLTALAVWFWPESPRWVGHVGPGWGPLFLEGFSPDGRVFVAVRTPPAVQLDDELPPVIYRFDAVSGKLLSRASLDCPDSKMHRRARPSPDGTAVLAAGTPITDLRSRKFTKGKWYLYDGLTGKRRAGPLGVASVQLYVGGAFSPDGRWFHGRRGDPDGGKSDDDSVNVYSSETGEVVIELTHQEQRKVGNCYFAADGRTVIVSWRSEQEGVAIGPGKYQVLELPSGREVRRFDMPKPNLSIEKWDGRFLEAIERVPDAETGGTLMRGYRIEVTEGGVGEAVDQPHLSAVNGGTAGTNYWINGPGWVAHCRIVPPGPARAPPPAWWAWTASKLGIPLDSGVGLAVTARIVDTATGATRYELPHPVGHPIQMSPDGRLLACQASRDSIEVWDTAPPPRWPKAAALGIAVAASVLGLGRWRQRARVKPSAV